MLRDQEYQVHQEADRLFCRARILYMDDDVGLGRLLQKRLERMACVVDIARDGTEGLEIFAKGTYDVVIADYHMPGVNGLEVLRQLKDHVPVIILTGQGDEKVAVDAMKLDAADYVAKDVSGEYIQLLPSIIDRVMERQQLIRDRKQVQAELLASEARYRAIVEDQTELICRFQQGGKLTFANAAFCRYFGIQAEDILFQSLVTLISRKAYQAMREVLKTLTPQNPVVTSIQNMKMTDGNVHWLHWTSRAIFDDAGRCKEYQLVARDITEFKLAKAALRDGEVKNSALLNAIADPLLRINRDGICVDLRNTEGQVGYLSPDFIGKHIAEFFPPHVVAVMQNHVNVIFQEGTSQIFQFELCQGGRITYLEARFVQAGKDEALTILRDVTAGMNLKQELQIVRQRMQMITGDGKGDTV